MAKVITLRLSDDEYRKVSVAAKNERRPISNLITMIVLTQLDAVEYVDAIEMAQIRSDKRLMDKLRAGHEDAAKRRGRFVD